MPFLPRAADTATYDAIFEEIGQGTRDGAQAFEASDWRALGALMDRNQTLLERMGVSCGELETLIRAARTAGAAVPVLPLEDTLKEVRDGRVVGTPDRSRVFRVQTPQGFLYPVLKQALDAARHDRFYGTDEAMLVERIGLPVRAVAGDPRNIKITTPLDLKIAEALLHA
jgi:2-C-methyl-D-erythritol 4-phosphate cytidylyltransferase